MLRIIRSAKNLLLSMTENVEIGSKGSYSYSEDKTVKKSPFTSKNSNRALSYLTLKARLAFNKLKKAFTKTPILQHFDPECYIRIESDTSGYVIGRVLSQLTFDNLG